MTREEQIKKEADIFAEQECEYGDIDRDALYKGFYWGAKWADEHPDKSDAYREYYEEQMRMIDKLFQQIK